MELHSSKIGGVGQVIVSMGDTGGLREGGMDGGIDGSRRNTSMNMNMNININSDYLKERLNATMFDFEVDTSLTSTMLWDRLFESYYKHSTDRWAAFTANDEVHIVLHVSACLYI